MQVRRLLECSILFACAVYQINAGAASTPVLRNPYRDGVIGAGGYHSLVVRSSTSVAAWGGNGFGQRIVPEPNSDFVAVSGGELHSLGLKQDGVIAAWGRNLENQLAVPTPNADFSAIAAGGYHSMGLKADGVVVVWGRNTSGQTNVPAPNVNFIAVAAGRNHSLGLKADGRIIAWGANTYGQSSVPAPNTNFVAMAGGDWHTLGLKSDGSIVAWGRNNLGQCSIPEPNTNFVAVAAGFVHSLALKRDGSLVAWGDHAFDQLEIPEPNQDFVAIAANGFHSLALRADGTVVAWGRNFEGQTNVAPPNADMGLAESGVSPGQGSTTGGYPVVVRGYFLGGDITNVSLAGIEVEAILGQTDREIVVLAGAAPGPTGGAVRALSASAGELIHEVGFQYIGEQVIAFDAIPDQIATNHVELTATASSGLPVSFSVIEGPAILSGGANLSFTGAGTVAIAANQAGDAEWYPAATVTQRFTVAKAGANIFFADAEQVYNGAPRPITVSTMPTGLAVSVTYDGQPVAPVFAGSYVVDAVIDDLVYAGEDTTTLVIRPAVPVITILAANTTYDGNLHPATVLTDPEGLTVFITYEGQTNVPVNAGLYEVIASVNEPNYVGAATATFSIAKADQSVDFDALPDQITTNRLGLAATASSGLPVGFNVAVGPGLITEATNLSFTAAGLVGVSASQPGNSNFNAGGVTVFFQVSKANQVIDFPLLDSQSVTASVALGATASSGLPVSYAVASGPGVLTNGNVLTFSGTGEVFVAANQAGDAIWNAAMPVTNWIEVTGDAFFKLDVWAGPNGSTDPAGESLRAAGATVTITAIPESYYVFTNWSGDVAVGDIFENPVVITMTGPKSITAHFTAQTTSGGIPLPWLVGYGITNDFEAAVLLDHDGDGVPTGEEYVADTDPTDGSSYLALDRIRVSATTNGIRVVLTAPVSTNRLYDVQHRAVSPPGEWIDVAELLSIAPVSSELILTNEPAIDGVPWYRLRVRLAP